MAYFLPFQKGKSLPFIVEIVAKQNRTVLAEKTLKGLLIFFLFHFTSEKRRSIYIQKEKFEFISEKRFIRKRIFSKLQES